jgi:hypothetical protein
MKKILIITTLFLILIPTETFAWGEKGHELVIEIAFKQLNKKTRKLLLSYLDGMSIEQAATWMDAIKKDHSYDKLKPLHYVNFDKNITVKDTCCDNIIHTLSTVLKDLKHYKDFSKEEVKRKLCYLFHLMGDIHQPLHVGYSSDKGGNSFQVNFNGKETNLHGLFDYGIIEYKGLNLKNCLKNKKYAEEELTELNSGTIVDWAKESRHFLNKIYATTNPIDDKYVEINYSLIKNQIQKAGLRLANILKNDFEE